MQLLGYVLALRGGRARSRSDETAGHGSLRRMRGVYVREEDIIQGNEDALWVGRSGLSVRGSFM